MSEYLTHKSDDEDLERLMLSGEVPSINCNASARSLAKLAAFMANKGTF